MNKNFVIALLAVIIAMLLAIIFFPAMQQQRFIEYKSYPASPTIALPEPSYSGLSVEKAIRERRSVRDYSNASISLAELSQLLYSAQGMTGEGGLRAAPSAGALYPLELYVFVNRCEGVAPGLYHYNVKGHSLELVREGDFRQALYSAAFQQKHVADGAAVFVFTASFARTAAKYGETGRAYVYAEAGHASENLLLEAVSLGLAAVPVGGFDSGKLNSLLEVDGKNETAIYINVVGKKD